MGSFFRVLGFFPLGQGSGQFFFLKRCMGQFFGVPAPKIAPRLPRTRPNFGQGAAHNSPKSATILRRFGAVRLGSPAAEWAYFPPNIIPSFVTAANAANQQMRRVISHFQPSQRRAYAQQLVTTRLLDYLHDPARQLSRLQRIQSCALYNCNTPASSPNFNETANAGLVRFWAKGLFVSDWCRRKSPRSGMDSDLEAFSHNPADGSFAAMPGQTAAKTNYLKPRFLSY